MTADSQQHDASRASGVGAAARRTMWAVAKRPRLWLEGTRAAAATTPRRWWRRRPYLPAPDDRYLEWRVSTAYGSPIAEPDDEDVAAYLRWRTRMRRG